MTIKVPRHKVPYGGRVLPLLESKGATILEACSTHLPLLPSKTKNICMLLTIMGDGRDTRLPSPPSKIMKICALVFGDSGEWASKTMKICAFR